MSHRTVIAEAKAEQASMVLACTIIDDLGVAIPAASLTTLTLTLYDKRTGNIINSRNAVNVLNANGGTVTAGGVFSMPLLPADAVLQAQTVRREVHVALIEWTWAAGVRAGRHEIEHTIENLLKVT